MQATQAAPAAARRDGIEMSVAEFVCSAGEWPERCVEAIEPKMLERQATERQRSSDGFAARLERFRSIEFVGNALVPLRDGDQAAPLAVVGYSEQFDCEIAFELVIVHPRTKQRGMVAEFEPAAVV